MSGRDEGLVATRWFRKGETIFTETPVASFSLSATPHCYHCCRSLVTSEYVRNARAQQPADEDDAGRSGQMAEDLKMFPGLNECWPKFSPVSCSECMECQFCSKHCWQAAEGYHALLCKGRVEPCAAGDDAKPSRTESLELLRKYVNCDAAVVDAGELEKIRTFPGLIVKLMAMVLAKAIDAEHSVAREANPPASEDAGRDRLADEEDKEMKQTKTLDECYENMFGAMVGVDESTLPAFEYEGFRRVMSAGMGLSSRQDRWLSASRVKALFAVLCANAIRARPSCPFETYVRTLRSKYPVKERGKVMDRVMSACRAVCGDNSLKPNRVDRAMWEAFGVEAACIYRLQSKCNHDCDANAESITYTLQDCTLDLVACKSVQPGSELCITYVDPELSAGLRQSRVKEMHGFVCTCRRCEANERWSPAQGQWLGEAKKEEELNSSDQQASALETKSEDNIEGMAMDMTEVDDFFAVFNL